MAGISTTTVADRQTFGCSGVTMGSARPASIKTTARRSLTSCSGSNVALSNRTRPINVRALVDEAPTVRRRRGPEDEVPDQYFHSPSPFENASTPDQASEGRGVDATIPFSSFASRREPTSASRRGGEEYNDRDWPSTHSRDSSPRDEGRAKQGAIGAQSRSMYP